VIINEGDAVTVDGSTGTVYGGEMPTVISGKDDNFQRVMEWADKHYRLEIMANADTIDVAKKAYELGAGRN
jgi:pyruvate,orthophosphate dikinase